MKITKEQIHKGSKKMSQQELQEHLKNMHNASSIHKNAKKYSRKTNHKGVWD